MDAFKLMKELKANLEQEVYYLPKETGLSLIESSQEVICFNKLPCNYWNKQTSILLNTQCILCRVTVNLIFDDLRKMILYLHYT